VKGLPSLWLQYIKKIRRKWVRSNIWDKINIMYEEKMDENFLSLVISTKQEHYKLKTG
jgi:hypothetical protein